MDKASTILGGLVGGISVLLVFAFVLNPPVGIAPPEELILSNGHGLEIVGEQTPLSIQRHELTLTEIFEQSESGVVRVNVERDVQDFFTARSVGSGFVFDKKGHIITNEHVINGAQRITVTFLDGTSYNARVVGKDPFTDIAVIGVIVDSELLHPLPLGDSSKLRVGEQVAAIGNPFGLSGSMTSGIVSQLGRLLSTGPERFSIPDVIQTDAAINPGNSGGPLLNMKGEVIGINTALQSGTGEFVGVGFAIPSNTVAKIVPVLSETGEYSHPYMGISGLDIDPDLAIALGLDKAKGFLIVTVVQGSPADKAGLQGSSKTKEIDGRSYPVGGDVILSVDGKVVREIADILIHLQREKSIGDEMVLEVLRDDKITSVILILEERPS